MTNLSHEGKLHSFLTFMYKKKHSLHFLLALHHLNELLQLGAVLQLGVAVEQQRGVVCVGQRLPVQRLQVCGQVVDPLSVQELPDNIRRLQFPDCAAEGGIRWCC